MGAEAAKFGFVESEAQCAECGASFAKRTWQHRFCSETCKERWHRTRNPAHIANNRARCARWAAANRGVEVASPWLLGAPPFEEYLPGAGINIEFADGQRFEHWQLNALHGLLTSLTGPHDISTPVFSLAKWHTGCGWAAFLRDTETAQRLHGTVHVVELGHRQNAIHFGPMMRLKSPRITKRGRRRLKVEALTPVCVRCTQTNGEQVMYTEPTEGNILSTLTLMTPKRIGLWLDSESVKLELVERASKEARVSLAGRDGRLGNMRGWVGHVIVDCNAPAHWLLEVAARIGFGGTTSFGFGRIKVTEV